MPRKVLSLLLLLSPLFAAADTGTVAVASNFQQTLDKVAVEFKAAIVPNHQLVV